MKKKYLAILGISFTILVVGLGASYSFLQIAVWGSKENVIKAGTLSMSFADEYNQIQLQNAIPIADDEGKKQQAYTFTIENTGSLPSSFVLYLDDDTITDGSIRISDQKVKYYLTRGKTDEEQGIEKMDFVSQLGVNLNRVLDSGILDVQQKHQYSLTIWVDANATNEVMNQSFVVKLRIEANQVLKEKVIIPNREEERIIPVLKEEDHYVVINTHDLWCENGDVPSSIKGVILDENKVLDLSGNQNHGTIVGAIRGATNVSLDGIDDYVDCGLAGYDFNEGQSMVIRASWKSEGKQALFSNYDVSGTGLEWNKRLRYYIYDKNQEKYVNTTFDLEASYFENKYHTYIGTYDGQMIKTYIDGNLVANYFQPNGIIKTALTPYLIGANPNKKADGYVTIENANMQVEEALIFDRVLTDEEIKAYYSGNVQLNDTNGLLFYYQFDQSKNLPAGTIIDQSLVKEVVDLNCKGSHS